MRKDAAGPELFQPDGGQEPLQDPARFASIAGRHSKLDRVQVDRRFRIAPQDAGCQPVAQR
ncbi:MAG: hypothetical protein AUH21_02735 [Nitrospirae bacterium 13_2_20CM_62_7]|nr:MAG: hypothetical protein AUH21_02735 [Nitrospirae bacterium 13_2_20CM_62_7]